MKVIRCSKQQTVKLENSVLKLTWWATIGYGAVDCWNIVNTNKEVSMTFEMQGYKIKSSLSVSLSYIKREGVGWLHQDQVKTQLQGLVNTAMKLGAL